MALRWRRWSPLVAALVAASLCLAVQASDEQAAAATDGAVKGLSSNLNARGVAGNIDNLLLSNLGLSKSDPVASPAAGSSSSNNSSSLATSAGQVTAKPANATLPSSSPLLSSPAVLPVPSSPGLSLLPASPELSPQLTNPEVSPLPHTHIPPPPTTVPRKLPSSCRLPLRRRIVSGLRLNLRACDNVVNSPQECCRQCKREARCRGWTSVSHFDCGQAGKGDDVSVCYMLSDVVGNYMDPDIEDDLEYFGGWNF